MGCSSIKLRINFVVVVVVFRVFVLFDGCSNMEKWILMITDRWNGIWFLENFSRGICEFALSLSESTRDSHNWWQFYVYFITIGRTRTRSVFSNLLTTLWPWNFRLLCTFCAGSSESKMEMCVKRTRWKICTKWIIYGMPLRRISVELNWNQW